MLLQKINNKGFTLIELAIVLCIILILTVTFSPYIYSLFVDETEVVEMTDEKAQPVPKQKEVNKQEEDMNKL